VSAIVENHGTLYKWILRGRGGVLGLTGSDRPTARKSNTTGNLGS
jgi:hypothetical protein